MPFQTLFPICSPPESYRLLAEAEGDLSNDQNLMQAAVAASSLVNGNVTMDEIEELIHGHTQAVRKLIPKDERRCIDSLLPALHEHFFKDESFLGPRPNMIIPLECSSLKSVLLSKCGSSTLLCLICRLVSKRLGFNVQPISIGSYYLLRVKSGSEPGDSLYLDPAHCFNVLIHEELRNWAKHLHPQFVWHDSYLETCEHRWWIGRIIAEMMNIYQRFPENKIKQAEATELMLVLFPDDFRLARDYSNLLVALNRQTQAVRFLQEFLSDNQVPVDDALKLRKHMNSIE